jgi:hypothetical protein
MDPEQRARTALTTEALARLDGRRVQKGERKPPKVNGVSGVDGGTERGCRTGAHDVPTQSMSEPLLPTSGTSAERTQAAVITDSPVSGVCCPSGVVGSLLHPARCTLHDARCKHSILPLPRCAGCGCIAMSPETDATPRHAAALPTRLGQAWNQPSGMPDESWTMTHRAPNRSTTTAHNRGAWRRGGARGGGSNHHKPLEWLSHTSLCKRTRCIHSPVY